MKNIKKVIFCMLFSIGILASLSAQNNSMKDEILKKIELDSFNNRIGLDMGMAILNLAKERNQTAAIKIERLNHTIFLSIDDSLPVDKHNWLKRKANVSKHFEESSLSVKNDLIKGNMTLKKTFV